jgi:prohibitin 2
MGGGGGGGGGSGGPAGISPAGPIGALLGLGALGYAGYNSFYTVEGGHRALLFNRLLGVKEEVYREGMHIMIPWFEMPVIYDIRPKPRMIQSLTGSKGKDIGMERWPGWRREKDTGLTRS